MLRSALLTLLIFMVTSCSSAKVTIYDPDKSQTLNTLAIMPVDYPAKIRREKVDAIVKSIEYELRNAGHIVLADKLVRKVCSGSTCPERNVLLAKYPIDGFVAVGVEAVTRSNFVAGFYNAVRGYLEITDSLAQPILQVNHTQSERGGLLFNTGQIFQAVLDYERNKEADSDAKLATGFAQALVSKIPRPVNADVSSANTPVSIDDVRVREVGPEVFEVCAKASEDAIVSVIINRLRTNLRPVSSNRFCGTFLHSEYSPNLPTVKVEARSPFGNSSIKEITLKKEAQTCNLENYVFLTEKNGRPTIQLSCPTGTSQAENEKCEQDKLAYCASHRFLVFSANSSLGPYKKIAEFRSASWTDFKAKKGSPIFYEIVSVNKSGAWSLPVAPRKIVPLAGENG
jgi:hypothetical protein